jgi:hypothetical protein
MSSLCTTEMERFYRLKKRERGKTGPHKTVGDLISGTPVVTFLTFSPTTNWDRWVWVIDIENIDTI